MGAMKDMLKRENVQIVDSCKGWEDSIHVAVQPLVDGGYVKSEYIDGIIENVHTFGPYFVLAPDYKLGEPVRVLVTLAAKDPDSHIDVMRILAMMFADPANIERAATAADADEVYQLFVDCDA